MRTWLRRIRGSVVMGLTWAVIWVPVALLMSMIVDPDGSMDEPWILAERTRASSALWSFPP